MTAPSTPLQVGIVGCGGMGQAIGVTFRDDARSTIAAITEIDDQLRSAAGDELGVAPAVRFTDFETMLARAELDAVLIATPHTLHYEQVTAALDQGLHVLCEKPLATELDHARELADRAASSEQVLMVGYQRHLESAFQKARDRWIDADTEPTFITAEITQRWIDGVGGTWRTDPEYSGGGYLYDTGSHILDAICWTTQLQPEWVSAEMTFIDDAESVDSHSELTIGFENGATASVSLFGDAPAVREHIHIWDDEGAVYLDGREWEPRTYSEISRDSATTTPYLHGRTQDKATAFLDSIVHGTEPPATARDALVVTAITEAAYESAWTGQRVDVDL